MPTSITATGTQVLNPTGRVVNIQDVLRLSQLTRTEILALASPVKGDMAFNITGTDSTGAPSLAVYDGSNWRAIELGDTI